MTYLVIKYELHISVLCLAIHDRVRNEGTFLVTSHYPTLANAVAGEPTPPPDIISEAVRIIHKGLIKLKEEIGVHGVEVNKFNPEEINRLRRSLAIMIYLAHRGLCGMEAKSVQFVLGSGNVGGKGKSSVSTSFQGLLLVVTDLDVRCITRFIVVIYRKLRLHLVEMTTLLGSIGGTYDQ